MPFSCLEHVADIRMRVVGNAMEELFRESVSGMNAIMNPVRGGNSERVKRTVVMKARDATALLADFLAKVLAGAHIAHEVYDDAEFAELSDHYLKAELRGYVSEALGEDIKDRRYFGHHVGGGTSIFL